VLPASGSTRFSSSSWPFTVATNGWRRAALTPPLEHRGVGLVLGVQPAVVMVRSLLVLLFGVHSTTVEPEGTLPSPSSAVPMERLMI
jgi:hypothetical protein